MNHRETGIFSAASSALFLGLAPIFGRQAILFGSHPLAVAAIRTLLAAILLLIVIAAFRPRRLYIYPTGLLGCVLAGGINGLGSLLFYGALARIDASLGQLLNSTYPLFVAIWFALDLQPPSKTTIIRLILMVPAIYLLTQSGAQQPDLVGVAMMLGAAALYALHLPINQRVLFEMPAPTVTLYTLIAMSAVVVPAYLLFSPEPVLAGIPTAAWWPLAGLTVVTFLSRLTLFLGIKHLGGMQTALIGIGELLVTIIVANIWLSEQLSPQQWLGGGLLVISILMAGLDKDPPPQQRSRGLLRWLAPRHRPDLVEQPLDLTLQAHPKKERSDGSRLAQPE